ncbi:MAG: Spy/CpxP family protein refolding chaperone [Elusimicrobiota bacterium]
MKKFICFCAIIVMAAGAAFAQMDEDMEGCQTLGNNMNDHPMKCGVKGYFGKTKRAKKSQGLKGMNQSMNVENYLGLKTELGLTDTQVTRLETIKTESQKTSIKKQSDIKIAEVDLKELKKKEPVDFKAVKKITKQISALRAESALAAIDAKENAYNVLTADQKEKLPEVLKEKKQKMKQKMKE